MYAKLLKRVFLPLLGIVLVAGLPGGAARSEPAARRTTDVLLGAYRASVRGSLTGDGAVVVSARHVHFSDIPIEDATGNPGALRVRASLGPDGRFKGAGEAMGRAVSVSGRVEAAGRTVRSGRLVCTFAVAGGELGRIVAVKEAPAPATGPGGGAAGAAR